jgi:acetoin utilization deacetylase AcuC-like enzyme
VTRRVSPRASECAIPRVNQTDPPPTVTLPIVFHPDYLAPLRPGHPFPMSKYGYLREALVARRLLPPTGGFLSPAPASVARVAAVHALAYVERVANQTLAPAETRAIGLPNTPAVARRAFLAAAGTLLAARLALEHGLACNMAGGSHHAGPEGGAGYCVFNDVAVAAQALLDEGRASRILIVDCDVHQGDGTARIFAGRPDVLTLSLHAERNYPARKAASHLDFPLPDRLGDRPYLEALAQALAAAGPFRPDLVFYNAGVDPHAGDRLGRLALSDAGLRARDRMVAQWARSRGLPLAAVLGGGYDSEPGRLAARHAILFEEAARAQG